MTLLCLLIWLMKTLGRKLYGHYYLAQEVAVTLKKSDVDDLSPFSQNQMLQMTTNLVSFDHDHHKY